MTGSERVQPGRKTLLANLVLFLICWHEAGWILPSLGAAEWSSFCWGQTDRWTFWGRPGGMSLCCTAQELGVGYWRLSWVTAQFGTPQSHWIHTLVDLVGLGGAVWLLWRLLPESLRRVLVRKADRGIAFV